MNINANSKAIQRIEKIYPSIGKGIGFTFTSCGVYTCLCYLIANNIPVSGQIIANKIGVSRVTVNNHLKFLEKNGFIVRSFGSRFIENKRIVQQKTKYKIIDQSDMDCFIEKKECNLTAEQILLQNGATVKKNYKKTYKDEYGVPCIVKTRNYFYNYNTGKRLYESEIKRNYMFSNKKMTYSFKVFRKISYKVFKDILQPNFMNLKYA